MPFEKDPVVAFHNMEATPALEADIRERIDRIGRRFDRLIGIRVAVEAQHRQHRTGNVVDVHIELSLPGRDVVVSREPKKARQKYADPDPHTSVRDAFKAAERQLKAQKQIQRGDVKPHDAPVPGHVDELAADGSHGFVSTAAGSRLYFDAGAVQGGRLEDLKPGESVHYVEATGDGGPAAMKVWRAGPRTE
jgi:ribosome-associated translation inhibitor RaiA/cold shock CspA family protein